MAYLMCILILVISLASPVKAQNATKAPSNPPTNKQNSEAPVTNNKPDITFVKKIFEFPFNKEKKLSLAYYTDTNDDDQKMGLFSQDQTLIQEIHNIPDEIEQSNDTEISVQSIELIDINADQKKDFILNIYQNTLGYDTELKSYFFINTEGSFIQASVSLAKEDYEVSSPFLKVSSPLIPQNDPYLSQEPDNKWLDFYIFEDGELTLANHLKKEFFQNKLNKSEASLKELIQRIDSYRPKIKSIETSQLELQEILEKIIYQKINIEKLKLLLSQKSNE